jgi:hypothetical protein
MPADPEDRPTPRTLRDLQRVRLRMEDTHVVGPGFDSTALTDDTSLFCHQRSISEDLDAPSEHNHMPTCRMDVLSGCHHAR